MAENEVLMRLNAIFSGLEEQQKRKIHDVLVNSHSAYANMEKNFDKRIFENAQSVHYAFENGQLQGMQKTFALVFESFARAWPPPCQVRKTTSIDVSKNPVRFEPEGWNILDVKISLIKEKILKNLKTPSQKKPAVVFDLDGTLFDVAFRTLGILREWLEKPEALSYDDKLLEKLRAIDSSHIGYSLSHAFENAGLDLRNEKIAEMFCAVEDCWRNRFFDGKALVAFDQIVLGSRDFALWCKDQGLHITYLTGRWDKRMREGTLQQLVQYGFPFENAELLMKPHITLDDHEFKQSSFASIHAQYEILANFENEYINIYGMAAINPDCLHVVVDSQHSGRPVLHLSSPVFRITQFL